MSSDHYNFKTIEGRRLFLRRLARNPWPSATFLAAMGRLIPAVTMNP